MDVAYMIGMDVAYMIGMDVAYMIGMDVAYVIGMDVTYSLRTAKGGARVIPLHVDMPSSVGVSII